ncbi:hypothetical protein RND81_04G230000 [Saponaria officinalis]|uniref:F-box associated domain-containing protein n=1 Tax=Saponaria officinalis TaxID=3572 RepID=A0AAW1LGS5_SAPOF
MAFNGEIYEIFSWLPPKLLYQLSSTSKPCSEFLSEFGFVEKQCRNSLIKPEEYVLIQDDFKLHGTPEYLQLCALDDKTPSSSNSISRVLKENDRVIASSNGLLLCITADHTKVTRLFLCNPTTKDLTYIELPSEEIIEGKNINLNIAWMNFICGKNYGDKNSKFPLDYTILLFNTYTWSNYRDVYVIDGDDNWVLKMEDLYIGPGNVDFQRPVHGIDGIYFLSDAGFMERNKNNRSITPYYVLHYDIQHGTSKILGLPDEVQNIKDLNHIKIGIFGWEKSNVDPSCFRSIYLVKVEFSEIISIWTLDLGLKDRTEASWKESLVMNKSIIHDLGIKDSIPWLPSFAIIEKNLIIGAEEYIYSYSLDKKVSNLRRISKIKDTLGAPIKFDGYSSTLRPCNKDTIRSLCRVI